MAIFRVEKTKDYTVMCNHHLKNRNLSYKARGMMSIILSLPDDWDYTLAGLAKLSKDGIDSVRTGINELEREGYIQRVQTKTEKGTFGKNEYIVYEIPPANFSKGPAKKESDDSADEKSKLLLKESSSKKSVESNDSADEKNKPLPAASSSKKSVESNNSADEKSKPLPEESSSKKSVTKENSTQIGEKDKLLPETQSYENIREVIKNNINYDSIKSDYNNLIESNSNHYIDIELIDEIVDLMTDVVCTEKDFYFINKSKINSDVVKSRFMKINRLHIEYIVYALQSNKSSVKNIRAYLISTLFNAPVTCNSFWQQKYQQDIISAGGG